MPSSRIDISFCAWNFLSTCFEIYFPLLLLLDFTSSYISIYVSSMLWARRNWKSCSWSSSSMTFNPSIFYRRLIRSKYAWIMCCIWIVSVGCLRNFVKGPIHIVMKRMYWSRTYGTFVFNPERILGMKSLFPKISTNCLCICSVYSWCIKFFSKRIILRRLESWACITESWLIKECFKV